MAKSHRSMTIEKLVERWVVEGFGGTASAGRILSNRRELTYEGLPIAKRYDKTRMVAVISGRLTTPKERLRKKVLEVASKNGWNTGRF